MRKTLKGPSEPVPPHGIVDVASTTARTASVFTGSRLSGFGCSRFLRPPRLRVVLPRILLAVEIPSAAVRLACTVTLSPVLRPAPDTRPSSEALVRISLKVSASLVLAGRSASVGGPCSVVRFRGWLDSMPLSIGVGVRRMGALIRRSGSGGRDEVQARAAVISVANSPIRRRTFCELREANRRSRQSRYWWSAIACA